MQITNYKCGTEVNLNKAMIDKTWLEIEDCRRMKIVKEANIIDYGRSKHCRYKDLFGKLKILVAGNSYALNQVNVIKDAFNGNYHLFDLVTYVPNSVIYSNPEFGEYSAVRHRVLQRIVKRIKPDVMFIVTRFANSQKVPIRGNIHDDPIVQEYQQNLDYYSRFVKKIMILGPFPLYPMNYLNTIIDDLSRGRNDMERLQLDKKIADEEMKIPWDRLRAVNCSKCQIYDLSQSFLLNDTYLGFDPELKLSYIDNDIHLTIAGLKRIEGDYRNIAKYLIEHQNDP
ncbi:hypothetical protein WR25_07067 [Diploscapter pachys]|uniref:SGNH domain-containing protein n=1 Tax=Diploscapter pachys TaxID=2018661 RepID=A0A2A2L862_9BILA|nr:hypothetical protein WR25_07067 [Diploscapter pachys]